jgi:hypothetical protein
MTRWLLFLISGLYLVLSWGFARWTPPWQVPDEPAHYNYIRFIATTGRLPVLRPGDYDQEYLSAIVSRGFPPELPIDPLRYEFTSPRFTTCWPLPFFRSSEASSSPSVCFRPPWAFFRSSWLSPQPAACSPERPAWALGVAAVFAFLPQHVTLNSGVNNDALAEALILGLWVQLAKELQGHRPRAAWIGSLLLGAGFLTKTTVYPMALVVLVAVGVRIAADRAPRAEAMRRLARWLLPALLLGGSGGRATSSPMAGRICWGCNSTIAWWSGSRGRRSGSPVTGWRRPWIASARSPSRASGGQFGWMGVVLEARWYLLFAWLSALGLLGLALHLGREGRRAPLWGWPGGFWRFICCSPSPLTSGITSPSSSIRGAISSRPCCPSPWASPWGGSRGWRRPAADGLAGACGLGILILGLAGILGGIFRPSPSS